MISNIVLQDPIVFYGYIIEVQQISSKKCALVCSARGSVKSEKKAKDSLYFFIDKGYGFSPLRKL